MTEEQIEILSPLITSLTLQKQKSEKEQMGYINDILGSYKEAISKLTCETLAYANALICDYLLKSEELKETNKQHSILFNPLRFFSIGETLHSFLIANLLNPHGEHGQGDLFLKSFLNKLEIEVFENDHWIVTAEKGRIDILLKRLHPHTVIIIENKSNYAGDQDNQLYRYWFQEIYLPNFKIFGKQTVEKTSSNSNYQIIYLTPAEWKLPADYSLMKPVGFDAELPDRMPIEPKIWLFNVKILEWLNETIQELHLENHRLREYIKQYIELWKY